MGKEIKHEIWNVNDLYTFFSEQQNTMKTSVASMQSATTAAQQILRHQIHWDLLTAQLLSPVPYLLTNKA